MEFLDNGISVTSLMFACLHDGILILVNTAY